MLAVYQTFNNEPVRILNLCNIFPTYLMSLTNFKNNFDYIYFTNTWQKSNIFLNFEMLYCSQGKLKQLGENINFLLKFAINWKFVSKNIIAYSIFKKSKLFFVKFEKKFDQETSVWKSPFNSDKWNLNVVCLQCPICPDRQ